MQKTKSEEYCQAITQHFPIEGKFLANLVMSVASYVSAKTVVEYSESPLFHYQYSSLYKFLARLTEGYSQPLAEFSKAAQDFMAGYLPPYTEPIRLQMDNFPLPKPLSPTLAERGVVYRPNEPVMGNKPLTIGYTFANLSQGFDPHWSLPLSLIRVKPDQKATQVGIEQVKAYLKTIALEQLVVGSADSSYATPEVLATLYPLANWVGVFRLKNRHVYSSANQPSKGGCPKIYGQAYDLRRKTDPGTQYKHPQTKQAVVPKPSIDTLAPDQTEQFPYTTPAGRLVKVQIRSYSQMRLRSKHGYSLKNQTFTLLVVDYLDDQTQQSIYQRPIYLALWGQKQTDLSPQKAYFEHYYHRYDMEGNHRFMKQQLLLDKLQTPHLLHLELWAVVLQLAQTLLFLTAQEVQDQPKKWQAYAPKPDQPPPRCSIAQTRKAAQTLFLTFDKTPFLPQSRKKGKGRKKGLKFPPKTFHPPRAKPKKKSKTAPLDLKCQKNC